jgi:EVE domain
MCSALSERHYWIGVAAKDHVAKGVAGGFCMFAHGKHTAVKRLSPGDRFAYYAPMTGMGTGETVRSFVAIGEILPGEPIQQQMGAAGTGWRRAARYFAARDAGIYLLLPQLSFVVDQSHWGMYFRRSLFVIGPHDFELIAEAMGASIH